MLLSNCSLCSLISVVEPDPVLVLDLNYWSNITTCNMKAEVVLHLNVFSFSIYKTLKEPRSIAIMF